MKEVDVNKMEMSPVLKYTNEYKETIYNLVLTNFSPETPCYILDVGCGEGTDLKRISRIDKDKKIYGIDSNADVLRQTAKRLEDVKNCNLLEAKGESIPFQDNFFNIVISSEVIEHTAQPIEFISEIHRVMKNDGVFIVTTPSRYNYVTLVGKLIPAALKRRLRKYIYSITPGDDINPHVHEYTPEELKNMLQANGFIVENFIPGVMRVPAWQLFDKFTVLLSIWKYVDKIAGKLPLGNHLKGNFVLVARKLTKTKSRVLVINLGGIGDVLLSNPALKALRNLYPGAEISMLVSVRVYEYAKSIAYIDQVYKLDIGYGGIIPFGKYLINFIMLVSLRKRHFDLAINMRTLVSPKGARKIKLVMGIIKPKVKVGRDTEGRGYFFDIKIPESDIGKKYEREYDVDIVEALGAGVTDKNIDFKINNNTIQKIDKMLEQEGVTNRDVLVGIHPGGMPSFRWPIENFSQVMIEINKQIKCKFVITGGKDESYLVDNLKKISGVQVINITGDNIEELGALIKRCKVYISNDTGPMHMAAILKTPLVAILGPGDITRYDPRNISDKVIVLYKKAECSPCNRKECDSLECLRAITVDEVVGAVKNLLNKSKG